MEELPEAVLSFSQNRDWKEVRAIQNDILNSTQEIDFLLQDEEDEIVPLEVKAETNVKAKSLRQFVADNQSKKAYRISMNDYQQEDWVTNVPLYAVNALFCLIKCD